MHSIFDMGNEAMIRALELDPVEQRARVSTKKANDASAATKGPMGGAGSLATRLKRDWLGLAWEWAKRGGLRPLCTRRRLRRLSPPPPRLWKENLSKLNE